ncbi:hypothetical protein B0H10DRAFT_1970505 [Mycena sp. CBHHK59/15]|nr:hypothetical protein B0H10DRAFT_1970505 [Mycena sp. CBHHK59/15]
MLLVNQQFERPARTFHLAYETLGSRVRGIPGATTPMPRVLGISEGEGTAPGPSVDPDKPRNLDPVQAKDQVAGQEAVTGTSRRRIEMTPALQGSVSGPESWEPRVGIPELITQSRETQELAA